MFYGNYPVAQQEEDVVTGLRSLLAELSSSWLRRRKAQVPRTVKPAKAVPRLSEHTTRQRPAHKPKPISTRDVASNM